MPSAIKIYQQLPAVLQSPYHHPGYVALDAKAKSNAKPLFFIYQCAGDTFYHPVHMIYTKEFNVFDFESARGYGGPIVTSTDADFLAEAFSAYKVFSLENKACIEFIRLSPVLDNASYYYGEAWLDRDTCAIDLTSYDLANNSHGAIANINKAIKAGCEVISHSRPAIEQIECFYKIYSDRMLSLSASSQYFYDINYFMEIFDGTNEMVWVEKNKKMIAAAIFLKKGSMAEYHLSAATDEGRSLGATNLILHVAATQYKKQSSVLHMGGGSNSAKDNKLYLFKRAMGKLIKQFYVGKFVHDKAQYDDLRALFTTTNNGRIIFYRN